jgi:hypothetical protein
MKKLVFLLAVLIVSSQFTACKNKEKKEETTEKKVYSIDTNKTEINWTAYKTTDKVPVSGKFIELTILKETAAENVADVLNGAEFSIPVSSIFSNNPDRDGKLKTIFFGAMKDTELLSGTIRIENKEEGFVDFKMNGIIEKLPFNYSVTDNVVSINAIMDTDTWKAQNALSALNEACFDLHKGADGVSKTWSDVAIAMTVYFK